MDNAKYRLARESEVREHQGPDLTAAQRDRPVAARNGDVQAVSLIDWTEFSSLRKDMTKPGHRQYLFIHSGGGNIEIDKQHWPVYAGSIIEIPETSTAFLTLHKQTRGVWFSGKSEFVKSRVIPALDFPRSQILINYYVPKCVHVWAGRHREAERDELLAEVERAIGRLGRQSDVVVFAYIIVILRGNDSIFNQLYNTIYTLDRVADNIDDDDMKLFMKFIGNVEIYFRYHNTISKYCEIMCVSRAKLNRVCKSVISDSPLNIINNRIMEQCKNDLIFSDDQIYDISHRNGFKDISYFSRFFKRYTGISPKTYRRMHSAVSESI